MGGESIKPIRKRIHVYFLMTAYEAISNYLMMIKGPKKNSPKLMQLIYDEEYQQGNYKGTWRELLVKYDLVEFLEVNYVGIY